MKRRLLWWLAFVLLWGVLPACGGGQAGPRAQGPPQNQSPDPPAAQPAAKPNQSGLPPFVLGPGDVVNIAVWRFDDLKRTVQIDPSGNITFPFVGQVQAAGLSQEQLAKHLEKRLAEHYVNPRVDVALSNVRSASVNVLGEVKAPTSLVLDKRMLLSEAIAKAGGLNNDADEERILIFRREGEAYRAQVASLRLKDRGDGQTLVPLTFLANEDIVYVPPAVMVDVTRFFSQVLGVLDPFTGVGRSVIIGDQVYKVFRNKSDTGVVVQP
jgi:polysaccharide export outer membrane protein